MFLSTIKNKKSNLWTKDYGLKTRRGFSMIELMVTVSIFAVISGLTLVNFPKFSSKILLENVAYSVGLSVRQAQSYGLNVRVLDLGGGTDLFPTYGVHFSLSGTTEDDPSDTKNFVLFADLLPDINDPINNNKKYDAVSGCNVTGGECVEQLTIQNANSLAYLCGNLKSTGATIENWLEVAGADCSLTTLDVAFTRPDPDATLTGYSAFAGAELTFSDAEVVIISPRGDTKTVVIWQTGQISIE